MAFRSTVFDAPLADVVPRQTDRGTAYIEPGSPRENGGTGGKEGARTAARADFSPDFPLRGHVHCSACGNSMTGAWSKGKYKHYAYYRCETRGCSQKSKSIPKARLEDGFEDVLKSLQPTKHLVDLAIAMFKDAWNGRLELAKADRA